MGIVVIGSLNMDMVVRTNRAPNAGETLMGQAFALSPGGKGANQAVAAARLGAEVSMIGSVGKIPLEAKCWRLLSKKVFI